ncbi:MAG: STAS/SEC14 domain-containing protein [Phycisphaeraceae bacterium]|nr:STAS/SEC14 domain-containing protein [Phycisphaeraceae bacterium]MCB9847218.1 STAS/SEC14 domain-containing protein [Phycisphaeraceae bacterium]
MLEFHQIDDTNVLESTLDGSLTREEYDRLTDKAEEMMRRFDKIRMIQVFRDLGKIGCSVIWADMKWGPAHLGRFERLAIVADQRWFEWMIAPFRPFVHAQIRCFHLDEIDEARAWITEDAPVAV